MPTTAKTRTAFLSALCFLILVAGCVWLRAAQFSRLPPTDRWTITDPDSIYHLRLAQLTFHTFPSPPAHDPYLNFPLGADVPWPFLQEWILAGAAKLTGGETVLPFIAFWYPVAMAVLALPLAFALGRAWGLPRWAAMAGAGFYSLVPVQIAYSLGGRCDHHAGDLVALPLFLLAAVAVWRRRGESSVSIGPLLCAVALALSTTAMLLNWLGASAYLLIFLAAAALLAARSRDPSVAPFLSRAGWSLVGGAGLLALLYNWAYGSDRLAIRQMDTPSGFHPLLVLAGGLFLVLVAAAASGGWRPLRRLSSIVLLALFAGSFVLIAPQVWEGVATFLLKADPGLDRGIAELQSPFLAYGSDPIRPRWSIADGIGRLSAGVFLLPPALFLAARRSDDKRGFPLVLFLVFALGLLALAVVRYRFGSAFALPCGIGGGVLLAACFDRWPKSGWVGKTFAVVSTIAVTAAFVIPATVTAFMKLRDPWHDIGNAQITHALRWIAENTPPPSNSFDLTQTPSYGVLSFWNIGHNIITEAHRPAAATGFFNFLPGTPFRESMEFFVEEDPGRAKALMAKNRLRYLVLSDAPSAVRHAERYLGVETRTPLVLSLWRTGGSATVSEGHVFPASGHFRKLFEDRVYFPATRALTRIQVFEVVEGAVLTGRAPPESMVTASLEADFPFEKAMVWRAAAKADAAGRYRLVVPYPSEAASGETRPLKPWKIRIPGEKAVRVVRVTEEQVVAGLTVEVR